MKDDPRHTGKYHTIKPSVRWVGFAIFFVKLTVFFFVKFNILMIM